MEFFKKSKQYWENIWLPRMQEGKTKVELERDKQYETNWVWYHTILAIELLICNVLLFWIATVLTVELLIDQEQMAKPRRQTVGFKKKVSTPKKTSIGKSKNSRPNGKHKNRRHGWKKYRGQGK